MTKKAIIFDFDGLIVDTESAWLQAYQQVSNQHGYAMTLQDFGTVIGTGVAALNELLMKNIPHLQDPEMIHEAAHAAYDELMENPTPRDGVLDYFHYAKRSGMKLAVASSSSRAWVTRYLEQFHVLDLFDAICTRDDVERVKPDPALYQLALKKLEVNREDALVFEDSWNGLQAAVAAGVDCVVVPNPVTAHLSFMGHVHRIESMGDVSLEELLQFLGNKGDVHVNG